MNMGRFNQVDRKRQSGFSLVEVLVTVGILVLVSVGVATMMLNLSRETKSVSAKSDFNSLVTTLQGVLNNSSSCLAAFGGKASLDLTTLPQAISVDIGGAKVQVGKYGNLFNITHFELTGKTPAGGLNQWVVPLSLVIDRGTGNTTAVGGNTLAHTFNLIMTVDATNKVVACAGQYSDYWVPTTANRNNITYPGGNVGIGTDTPTSLLDVNGIVVATSYMYRSDLRLKENIREIPDPLERTLKLRGVVFDWKNQDHMDKGTDQLGFIAQEVERVFPEAVSTHPATDIKSVAYGNLIAPLIEAMKDQQKIIDQQQREIAEIKNVLKSKQSQRR
ncbi:MAG: hypothetical protein OM95_08925 [Bdellovibrio sp. ArHS]|uniref:tail fiber domain-containing protein n=1 Tax=Bdellovibrio sp. ArHS TaxID=1569284 RepID=UPI0005827DE7|nr:tail fiber domain-containing protein [Bdellovibrio sp. ArHS]KHD88270.1 MAG: hypothetical protein OM95_08925 [Bdellovibrio sp. ArHS]